MTSNSDDRQNEKERDRERSSGWSM